MAWTTPKRWLPQDRLTAAELNTYVRDNFLETLPATTANSSFEIASTSGPNQVKWGAIEAMHKPGTFGLSTSVDTTSTTPVKVAGMDLTDVDHSGSFLLLYQAELANSTAAEFTYFMPGPDPATASVADHHSCSVQGTSPITVTGATVWWPAYSVTDIAGYFWCSGGTAFLYGARYTFIPL